MKQLLHQIGSWLLSITIAHAPFITQASPNPGISVPDSPNTVAIIPRPVAIQTSPGVFTLPSNCTIAIDLAYAQIAKALANRISAATGLTPAITPGTPNLTSANTTAAIRFHIIPKPDTTLGAEGYRLNVTAKGVDIAANQPAGLFYGMQTLLQLLPPDIESSSKAVFSRWTVPYVTITDYPRFAWRGLLFDVVRHYFDLDQVKALIDDMARYKYNLLHLHLSDDQGWRMEIRGLPRLTEVGAWNVARVGANFGSFTPPAPGEPRTAGGYFTQQQLKDLVAYAKTRYIDILPEIDIPGHSMAAVASYPELSGTPGSYVVNSGENFMNYTHPESETLGDNELLVDNTLNPVDEKVYAFLDKVFTQVAEIFPFGYIHMGGDECVKTFWKTNPAIKALMQKENLTTLDEVQSYFVRRVQKIINAKGKKMIGWDEILQGGLAPGATVMSWNGAQTARLAASQGHPVVMTPCYEVYLDLMQGDSALETPVYATVKLSTAYKYDPLPDSVDPKYILGGQANIWTEKIYNSRHLQYMLWPRAFAISESLWSPAKGKDFDDFIRRTEQHFIRFDHAHRKYATSMYEPSVKVSKNDAQQLTVALSTEIKDVHLYYSFDNSYPDEFYPEYNRPLLIPPDLSNLRIISYRNGKPVGRTMTLSITSLRQRAL